jgi:hypothetical protein
VTLKRDGQGREIPVLLYNYVPGFKTQPKKFPFDLTARSEKKWTLLQKLEGSAIPNGPEIST